MFRRALSILAVLLVATALAQPRGVSIQLLNKKYLHDPEKDLIWGVQVTAVVSNETDLPVANLMARCGLRARDNSEPLSKEQAVGTVPPRGKVAVQFEIRRTDLPEERSDGIPGMSSGRKRPSGSGDPGKAAFEALVPVLTVK